jgi:hypothetical protein
VAPELADTPSRVVELSTASGCNAFGFDHVSLVVALEETGPQALVMTRLALLLVKWRLTRVSIRVEHVVGRTTR